MSVLSQIIVLMFFLGMLSNQTNLQQFLFKEVLGGDPARKTIFLLLEHVTEKKPAVLSCDKNPFLEESAHIAEWIKDAKLSHIVTNDIYGNYELFLPEKFNAVKTSLIYPANQRHIDKYCHQETFMVYETAEDFQNITSVYIESRTFCLNWVYNILEKKSEAERIVLEDVNPINGFLLAPDLKWNGVDVENLYLQAIVNRRDIRCVRDLTAQHLPLLENLREKCVKLIQEKYGLKKNQLMMYFHYQPTYYHLHVHIINVRYEVPGHHATSIFLDVAIANIKLFSNYYQRAVLPFTCRKNHPLYKMFCDENRM